MIISPSPYPTPAVTFPDISRHVFRVDEALVVVRVRIEHRIELEHDEHGFHVDCWVRPQRSFGLRGRSRVCARLL